MTRMNGDISGVAVTQNPEVDRLRAPFEVHGRELTVGLEEELMLLHPETLDLRPCAPELLTRLDGDARFKGEMPAAQLEIAGTPAATVGAAAAELLERRIALAQTADGLACIGGAGVHPFAAAEGVLNGGERYDAIAAEYG
ncbi:MAG: glutamate---cysteine ligase / carboxylate-amine ligase, partial [Baekduia sp.]|nr:glutamate---cysteine ligase / carboxylate-amine ligase [Baekduia sp.]